MVEEKRLPAPANGEFPALETLSALFTYYQNTGEEYSRERTLKLAAQRKRAELDLARAKGQMVLKAEVAAAFGRIAAAVKGILTQKLENEYPVAVAGLNVPEARIYGGRIMDEIVAQFRELAREFEAMEGE